MVSSNQDFTIYPRVVDISIMNDWRKRYLSAEVCPVPLRHYLTAYVNLSWIIRQLISAGVLRGLVNRQDIWG